MLNVLIAEDDVAISIHLSNIINTKEVRCIEILNDGTKVYQRLKNSEVKIDILILDLKMPGKNGIDILKEIQADESIKTKVFVYSGEVEYMTLAREYKCIDKFYSKLTPPTEISRYLQEIADEISNKSVENRISNILLKLGFSYSLKGTRLIKECILYSVIKNEDNIKSIYSKIARNKKENIYTIKSDINTAINNMWRFTDRDKARKILRLGESDRPSSKVIVSMIKYYINN